MADTAQAEEIKRLFDTGAHFAQVKSRRHPSMKSYLVGSKGRHELIDLAETCKQLENAKAAMRTLAAEGKIPLFVGGKVETAQAVKRAAERIGAPYVAARWLGGTISNWPEIKKRIDRLAGLEDGKVSGALAREHTKLELVRLERERARLTERLGGIRMLTKRPDALVVVDTRHERHAVKEAKDAGIPVIGVMSSDCNIHDAAYPIVSNDASREAVALILGELVSAYDAGRKTAA